MTSAGLKLYLSASVIAFDTIDHGILLDKLQSQFGISGFALALLKSYLLERTQFERRVCFLQ